MNFSAATLNTVDIKKLIKEIGYKTKFQGIAPVGFLLIHEKTFEDLKDFDVWKSWKNGEISIDELNKNNFENT